MLGDSEAPGGYPLTPLGMPRAAGWISDRCWVILGSLFGALWEPSETQLAFCKPANMPKEIKKWV